MLSASKAALLMHLWGSCANTGGCLPFNSHPHKDKSETFSWLLCFNYISSFFFSLGIEK